MFAVRTWIDETLKGEATIVILATCNDGSVLLASDEVKAENGERYGSQNDSKSTVINAQRKPGAIAIESVINLAIS